MKFRVLAVCALVIGAAVSGCSSSGYAQADDTSASMQKTDASLAKGSRQVQTVINSLDAIVAAKSGNLRPPYEAFSSEVDRTVELAESVRKTTDSMRAKTDARFEEWAKEAETITTPELKEAAQARRGEAKQSFARVVDAMDLARTAYQPFKSGLLDIRTALGQDLTAGGVDAANATINRVKADGVKLQAALGDVQAAASKVRSQLTSPKTAPATK